MRLDRCEMASMLVQVAATFAVVYNVLALRNQRRLDLALRAEENFRVWMRECKRDFEMRNAI
jgi:hypothetical protein